MGAVEGTQGAHAAAAVHVMGMPAEGVGERTVNMYAALFEGHRLMSARVGH